MMQTEAVVQKKHNSNNKKVPQGNTTNLLKQVPQCIINLQWSEKALLHFF